MTWCGCKRYILTLGQIQENKPCDLCQKEHADSLKRRVEDVQKEDKDD
jgi:hypothetical protein